MSEEQLSALIAKLKEDAGLQQKVKSAADLDAALAITKDAGFAVRKADLLRYKATSPLQLNDDELEVVAAGVRTSVSQTALSCCSDCITIIHLDC